MKNIKSVYKTQLQIKDQAFQTTTYSISIHSGLWTICVEDFMAYVLEKGKIALQEKKDVDLVFFNPETIVHPEQIKMACYHALSNMINGQMLLNDSSLEYLLYLGQQRQIGKILKRFSLQRVENQEQIPTGILVVSQTEEEGDHVLRELLSEETFRLDFFQPEDKIKNYLEIYEIENEELQFSLNLQKMGEITQENWANVQKTLVQLINERMIEFKLQNY